MLPDKTHNGYALYIADTIIPLIVIMVALPLLLIFLAICVLCQSAGHFFYVMARVCTGKMIYQKKVIDNGYHACYVQLIAKYGGYVYIFEPQRSGLVIFTKLKGRELVGLSYIDRVPETRSQFKLQILYI